MATYSSTLARKIPWTEEPGGLHSMGLYSQTQLSEYACSSYMKVVKRINPKKKIIRRKKFSISSVLYPSEIMDVC